jgi:hypothetical protein
MPLRTLAAAGALLTALAVPAGAQAVVAIEPLEPCYVTASTTTGPQSQPVFLRATGFTANSKVDLAVDGQPVPDGVGLQTDATGTLGAISPISVPAPFIPKGTRDFTVTLTEEGNTANTATVTTKTTALGVSVNPSKAKPSHRVRFRGLGFTANKKVYAHYVFRGKLRKTVKMAKPTAPCGAWTSHKPQIPIKNPKTGSWFVQFDQIKKYVDPSKKQISSVYVRLRIDVSRVFPN